MVCLVQHKFKIKSLQYCIQCHTEFKTNSHSNIRGKKQNNITVIV